MSVIQLKNHKKHYPKSRTITLIGGDSRIDLLLQPGRMDPITGQVKRALADIFGMTKSSKITI